MNEVRGRSGAADGHLASRPGRPVGEGPTGLRGVATRTVGDGLLHVPAGYRPDHPAPLVVMLHGAGGIPEHGLGLLRPMTDSAGPILLAPASRRSTWDLLLGGYGPDVASIDKALELTFDRYAIDPNRIAIGGFSDGASYALSLGLINGDLFTHVIAFSPGFVAPGDWRGRPRTFLAHGVDDRVLPIDLCSRQIVPRLRRAGYDVHYREFDGSHTVPAEIALEAVEWFQPTKAPA